MSLNKLKKGLVGCIIGLSFWGYSYARSPLSRNLIPSYHSYPQTYLSDKLTSANSLEDWLKEKVRNPLIPFAPPNPLERWKVILAGSVFYGAVGGGMGLLVYSLIASNYSKKKHEDTNYLPKPEKIKTHPN